MQRTAKVVVLLDLVVVSLVFLLLEDCFLGILMRYEIHYGLLVVSCTLLVQQRQLHIDGLGVKMSQKPPALLYSYMYLFGHIYYLSLSVNLLFLD